MMQDFPFSLQLGWRMGLLLLLPPSQEQAGRGSVLPMEWLAGEGGRKMGWGLTYPLPLPGYHSTQLFLVTIGQNRPWLSGAQGNPDPANENEN